MMNKIIKSQIRLKIKTSYHNNDKKNHKLFFEARTAVISPNLSPAVLTTSIPTTFF